MFKKIVLFLSAAMLLLFVAALFNMVTAPNKQRKIEAAPLPALAPAALEHFRDAVRIPTISFAEGSAFDSTPFVRFRQYIESTYPLVHSHLQREIISGYSYLYKWEGKNKNLAPYILMAHQDVVPIEAATKKMWSVDPFAAVVKDGYVWGRGTTDDKINLISILEAAEKLLKENFQPERTVYFIFGHDEELGGKKGAEKIARILEARKIKAELILDEGGFVTKEKVPGLSKPVALIATSEKGYLSLKLSVHKKGGHSSIPEQETAIDILSKALVTLRSHPFPARFAPSTKDFMAFVGPEMKFPNNMALASPRLFKNMIVSNYAKTGAGNALMRTTGVPTILESGVKDNVVPTVATAVVNFRLLPGDSSQWVRQRVKEIIDDPRVEISLYSDNVSEGSPAADASGQAYLTIDSIARRSFEHLLTAPLLLTGGTDSRHFTGVSDNIFKFSPMIDPIGFHSIDERVSIESFQHSLWFFEQLLRSCK